MISLAKQWQRGYHKNVLEHFSKPRNVGSLDAKDKYVGTAMVGKAVCGDMIKLQLRVDDDGMIQEAKFKTFGCGSAIASSSYVTELVQGKHYSEALKLTNADIADHLKLPPVKIHCSLLAEEAVKAAIGDLQNKKTLPKEAVL